LEELKKTEKKPFLWPVSIYFYCTNVFLESVRFMKIFLNAKHLNLSLILSRYKITLKINRSETYRRYLWWAVVKTVMNLRVP
jgi:hypothetical protein